MEAGAGRGRDLRANVLRYLDDGTPVVIRRGDAVRGDHEAVRKWPQYFLPGDTLEYELPSDLRGITYERHPKQSELRPSIPREEAVRAHTSFSSGTFGQVNVGTVLHRDSEIVRAHPEMFETLPQPVSASG